MVTILRYAIRTLDSFTFAHSVVFSVPSYGSFYQNVQHLRDQRTPESHVQLDRPAHLPNRGRSSLEYLLLDPPFLLLVLDCRL